MKLSRTESTHLPGVSPRATWPVHHVGPGGCASRTPNFAKGSVESTHNVPTSHYHTKHCHAVTSLSKLSPRPKFRAVLDILPPWRPSRWAGPRHPVVRRPQAYNHRHLYRVRHVYHQAQAYLHRASHVKAQYHPVHHAQANSRLLQTCLSSLYLCCHKEVEAVEQR